MVKQVVADLERLKIDQQIDIVWQFGQLIVGNVQNLQLKELSNGHR